MLVDFGSGGGFPALPLALAGVGERWTLVESRRNKTLFLRRAIQELGAGQVDVLTGRLGYVGFWQSWFRKFPQSDIDEAFRLLQRVGLDHICTLAIRRAGWA